MFKKGDRVRIANQYSCSKAMDCDYGNRSFSLCPFEDDDPQNKVGRFGIIHEIRKKLDICAKLTEVKDSSPNIFLYIRLEKLPTEITSSWIETSSLDVVNYSLLREHLADQIFEETRQHGFQWTDMFKKQGAIVNHQMMRNLEKIVEPEKIEIETTIKIFRDQAHSFYHKLSQMQLEMNRDLRQKYHRKYTATLTT